MTIKERMLAAINLQDVDRVPHSTYNIHPYLPTAHSEDSSYAEILQQIGKSAGAAVKIGAIRSGYALSRNAPDMCESVSASDDSGTSVTSILHTPKGDLTAQTRFPHGQPSYIVKHLVESDEDMDKYRSIPYDAPDIDAESVRRLYDAIGDRGLVFLIFEDPMYAVASLMDYEDFCVRTLTDLDWLESVVQWACERSAANVELLCKACEGMDLVVHTSGPELCTTPMVSPNIFPVLVTPFLTRIVEVIHNHNLKAAIHCHGQVREVFSEMIKTGADLLEPIEPPEQGNISLQELMEQAEGRICLMGHVQDQEFYFDNPGHFERWTEYVKGVVGGRTGYIMSPTCTPFSHPCPDIYQRNYLEWLRAADRIL